MRQPQEEADVQSSSPLSLQVSKSKSSPLHSSGRPDLTEAAPLRSSSLSWTISSESNHPGETLISLPESHGSSRGAAEEQGDAEEEQQQQHRPGET